MLIDAQLHAYERNHPGRPWHAVLAGPPEATGDQTVAMLDQNGVDGAILISAAIRMSYHVYQGPVAALFIGILGLVFAASFARTGKLWPVIMAHAGLDLTGLAQS